MTRLGLTVPFFNMMPVDDFVAVVREIEDRGYDTAWTGETTAGDAFTPLTLIAAHTKRLRLATGVVPVQTRTPVLLGLSGAALGRIAPNRVAVGIGLSSPVVVDQWNGVRFSRSLDQLREAVQIIRGVLSGERLTFEGKFYRVRNFRLSVPPPPGVKVYLAALGPKALELAGEIADGVLLNWIAPDTVPASVRHIAAGAERGKRSLDGFEIAAFIRTSVTDDPGPARQWLAREITSYCTVDVYAQFFRASGFAADVDAVRAAWNAGDRAGAVQKISARFIDALGVVGSADACRARVAEFARSGLTMPVVFPFSADPGDPKSTVLRTIRTFP